MSLFLFKMTLFLLHIWQAAQKGCLSLLSATHQPFQSLFPVDLTPLHFMMKPYLFLSFFSAKIVFCSHIYYPLLSASWNKRFFSSLPQGEHSCPVELSFFVRVYTIKKEAVSYESSIQSQTQQRCGNPGFGSGRIPFKDGEETYNAVRWALDAGYRHIDTAAVYRNEASVGRAIEDSGIPRDQIWITTKLWNDEIRAENEEAAFAAPGAPAHRLRRSLSGPLAGS